MKKRGEPIGRNEASAFQEEKRNCEILIGGKEKI